MKDNLRGRDKFNKYKTALIIIERFYRLLPLSFRKKSLVRRRNASGMLGIGLRYSILKSISDNIGDLISVFQGVYLLYPENLTIGSNVSIQPNCYIDAEGSIIIGNDVSIAHGATVLSTTHNFERKDLPIKEQGITMKKTIIEDDVWIGAKATIIAGVHINSGAIIGAGAVVTHDVGENEIVGGVPAKVLRKR